MRGDWTCCTLDEACDITYGTRVIRKRDAGIAYPVYGGGGETFRIDKFNREDCAIVSRFGMSESCVRYVKGKFFLNDSGLSVFPKNTAELLNRFLDYFLFSIQKNIFSLGKGSAQKNLDVKAFRKLEICYPQNINEQKYIVAILDEAFAGIETAIANTTKNLANARELFGSYRDNIFSSVPDGWAHRRLGELCTIKHGFAFKSQYFEKEGDYVLLTPGSFWESGGFRDQGAKTKYYVGEIPNGFLLNKGDFLIAMTEQAVGLLGSSLVVPEANRYLHNQRLGLVQVKDGIEWNNDFFFHQFNTRAFRAAIQATASGVKVRHTSPQKLGAIRIKYPTTKSKQARVARQLNEISVECHRLEANHRKKIAALTELKQSLLQKAFSSELTPDKTKHEVQEAVA